MYLIRKTFKFEYAHQLFTSYTDGCREQIHGHSGKIELFFSSEDLNNDSVIIDFTEVKTTLKNYMDSWDHSLIMPDTFNSEYIDILKKYNRNLKIVPYNPTAEAMAKEIFEYVIAIFPKLTMVRLHETDTGYAEYSEE